MLRDLSRQPIRNPSSCFNIVNHTNLKFKAQIISLYLLIKHQNKEIESKLIRQLNEDSVTDQNALHSIAFKREN